MISKETVTKNTKLLTRMVKHIWRSDNRRVGPIQVENVIAADPGYHPSSAIKDRFHDRLSLLVDVFQRVQECRTRGVSIGRKAGEPARLVWPGFRIGLRNDDFTKTPIPHRS
jgi:hypothetical protein